MRVIQVVLVLIFMCVFFMGCHQPAVRIAEDIEEMAVISESLYPDCGAIEKSMREYLKEHGDEMRERFSKLSGSTDLDSRRIQSASLRLDKILESCSNQEGIKSIKLSFSSIVLDKVQ